MFSLKIVLFILLKKNVLMWCFDCSVFWSVANMFLFWKIKGKYLCFWGVLYIIFFLHVLWMFGVTFFFIFKKNKITSIHGVIQMKNVGFAVFYNYLMTRISMWFENVKIIVLVVEIALITSHQSIRIQIMLWSITFFFSEFIQKKKKKWQSNIKRINIKYKITFSPK